MDGGRKIPAHLENPIDNGMINMSNKIAPTLKSWHLTPNHITTISAIFGALTLYSLAHSWYAIAGIAHIIQYFFDCVDGNYARTYNMVTVFGDYYDHIKDLIVGAGIMIIILGKRDIHIYAKCIFLSIAAYLLWNVCMYVTCQEGIYGKKESKTLEAMQFIKVDKSEYVECLQKHKNYAFGTLNVFISLFMISLSVISR
jgi:phosphatidylglycerophosphate synthase